MMGWPGCTAPSFGACDNGEFFGIDAREDRFL